MWVVRIVSSLLALVSAGLSQSEIPKLRISEGSAWQSTTNASRVFTVLIPKGLSPTRVELVSVDAEGAVHSKVGTMVEDGGVDPAPYGRLYGLSVSLPVDKVGCLRFRAKVTDPASPVPIFSYPYEFRIVTNDPSNREGDLWALIAEDGSYVKYVHEAPTAYRRKFYRGPSSQGPWTLIDDRTEPRGLPEKEELFDGDLEALSADAYYKVELLDAASVLIKTLSPLLVKANSSPAELVLDMSPVRSRRAIAISERKRRY